MLSVAEGKPGDLREWPRRREGERLKWSGEASDGHLPGNTPHHQPGELQAGTEKYYNDTAHGTTHTSQGKYLKKFNSTSVLHCEKPCRKWGEGREGGGERRGEGVVGGASAAAGGGGGNAPRLVVREPGWLLRRSHKQVPGAANHVL